MSHHHVRGFTLIEILIVVAIISILALIVLGSLGGAREKGRDARRNADIEQYELAIELYFERHDAYPSCSSWQDFSCLQDILESEGLFSDPPQGPTFDPDQASDISTPDSGYHYDNWCSTPSGQSTGHYRLWSKTERDHDGLAHNWWSDSYIGATQCDDPS